MDQGCSYSTGFKTWNAASLAHGYELRTYHTVNCALHFFIEVPLAGPAAAKFSKLSVKGTTMPSRPAPHAYGIARTKYLIQPAAIAY